MLLNNNGQSTIWSIRGWTFEKTQMKSPEMAFIMWVTVAKFLKQFPKF